MPVKVLADNGCGSLVSASLGVDFAVKSGAKVINMSLGGYGTSEQLKTSINNAVNKGVTVVVAAGNENSNASNYSPASVSNAITVAAVDKNNKPAGFSNYGSCVDISAPGVNINSSIPGGFYASNEGTSMAAPFVAAMAAMLKMQDNNRTPYQIESLLKNNATPIGYALYGSGIVKMSNFIVNDEIPNKPSPTANPRPTPTPTNRPVAQPTPTPTPKQKQEPAPTNPPAAQPIPKQPELPPPNTYTDIAIVYNYMEEYYGISQPFWDIHNNISKELNSKYTNASTLSRYHSDIVRMSNEIDKLYNGVSNENMNDLGMKFALRDVLFYTKMHLNSYESVLRYMIKAYNEINNQFLYEFNMSYALTCLQQWETYMKSMEKSMETLTKYVDQYFNY